MATQQRIYLVGTPDGKTRLIKAALRQQALSHVANSLLSVRVASQDDLVAEISKGTQVEQYNNSDQRDLIEESQSEAN
jgi:phosphopantetheine adenylyltransferase